MGLNILQGDVGLLDGEVGRLEGDSGLLVGDSGRPICEIGLLDGVQDICLLSIVGDMGRPDRARFGESGLTLDNSVISVDWGRLGGPNGPKKVEKL